MPLLDKVGDGVAGDRIFKKILEMPVEVGEGFVGGLALAKDAGLGGGTQDAIISIAFAVEKRMRIFYRIGSGCIVIIDWDDIQSVRFHLFHIGDFAIPVPGVSG